MSCAFSGLFSGCENDLPRASNIERMRVLGGQVAVIGDEARSTPKPGEKARLTWNMAYPDPAVDDSQLASVFLVCTAPEQFTGVPICQEVIDVARGGSISGVLDALMKGQKINCADTPDKAFELGPFTVACVTGTPKLDVPIAKDSRGAGKLVRGIICKNASPRFDPKDPTGLSCDGDTEDHIAVYGTVPIQRADDESNQNPNIDATSLFFHDPPIPWQPVAEDVAAQLNDETCLDEAKAMRVMHSDGHEEQITLRYDADQREEHDGKPEGLEFSVYATFGKISQRFTIFKSDAELPLKNTFKWELSEDERKELNEKSRRVRFFFTLMDGRGGFSATSRDLCINRR
jgi:hypothetical protein